MKTRIYFGICILLIFAFTWFGLKIPELSKTIGSCTCYLPRYNSTQFFGVNCKNIFGQDMYLPFVPVGGTTGDYCTSEQLKIYRS